MTERQRGSFLGLFGGKETRSSPEQQIYHATRAFYRAWHIAEGEKRAIIDFDLTERPSPFAIEATELIIGSPNRAERSKIVERLEMLHSLVSSTEPTSNGEVHNLQFLSAQVEASLWFAKRLARHRLDPFTYIEKTMGVRPEIIPEELLFAQKDRVLTLLSELGIETVNARSITELRVKNALDQEAAQTRLREDATKAIQTVANFIGEKVTDVEFEIQPVEEDQSYWWVYADTDKRTGRFLLRQNFSLARGKIWTPGKSEELGPHEGGEHILRMALRRDQISKGKLDPVFGLTTVHGPEAVVDEGLAQTITFYVPGVYKGLSPEGKFQVEATILRNFVYNNVHIMINDPAREYRPEDIARYVHRFIPWETKEEIFREIRERKDSSLLQTYRYAYGIGARLFLLFAENLGERGKREFLRNIYLKPYTISQVSELFNRLIGNVQNVAPPKSSNGGPFSEGDQFELKAATA